MWDGEDLFLWSGYFWGELKTTGYFEAENEDIRRPVAQVCLVIV